MKSEQNYKILFKIKTNNKNKWMKLPPPKKNPPEPLP